MMFARCPACQTVFRVRPEQIGARRGEVRCGHCFHPFNALDHLLVPANARRSPPNTSAPPQSGVSVPVPAPKPAPAPDPLADTAAAAPSVAPAAPLGVELDFEIPEVWRSPRASKPAQTPPPETEAPSALDFSAALAGALADAGAGRTEPGSAPTDEAPAQTPAEELTAAPPAAEPRAAPVESPPAADLPADADANAAHYDIRYGPAPAAGRRWLWGLGVGVLLGMLAVQAAYLFRADITRSLPMLRPLYLAACAQLGCTVPLAQDAEQIGIIASDLQSDPRTPGRYTLEATVRNRAAYPQAWPHLELTLTDIQDRPLVRRVLTPEQWAQAETAKLRAGFPAGRDQTVTLHFDAPGLQAAGYRLYIFYP
ncbi:hypothetical protein C3497_12275 [Zoogloeaceae bacteirum Par-f-2]|nr:hypothetical protein C3497_12275 [Zoogloeaceae bacteirum Par-f-2]